MVYLCVRAWDNFFSSISWYVWYLRFRWICLYEITTNWCSVIENAHTERVQVRALEGRQGERVGMRKQENKMHSMFCSICFIEFSFDLCNLLQNLPASLRSCNTNTQKAPNRHHPVNHSTQTLSHIILPTYCYCIPNNNNYWPATNMCTHDWGECWQIMSIA